MLGPVSMLERLLMLRQLSWTFSMLILDEGGIFAFLLDMLSKSYFSYD